MKFTLKIWRQENAKAQGHFETYKVDGISPDTSFLEMMDILNEQLVNEKINPVAFDKGCKGHSGPVSFDHDCREGICGALLGAALCHLFWIFTKASHPDDRILRFVIYIDTPSRRATSRSRTCG